jgi:hypothetical protein
MTMGSPTLKLTLTPHLNEGMQAGMQVAYVLEAPDIAAGETLFHLPTVIVGVPGAQVETAEMSGADEAGALALAQEDEPPTAAWTYRRWTASRATVGDLRVSYFAPVRRVDASTINGPLYDLRLEAGGLNGAGITFLALPDTTTRYDVSIAWDLSQAPAGARGVCSLGEGPVQVNESLEDLAYTYFMAGPLSAYPDSPASVFSMYWLSEPTFDPIAVGSEIERLYFTMCEFFQEPEPGFRVFARKHPYRGNGGTAVQRSFMFGYSDGYTQTAQELTSLLAHETAHTWPRLDGDQGETAWYSEGTAEYYSIVLAHRAGFISDTAYLEQINDRARSYYTNPLQTLSNHAAVDRFWRDPRAQRVPYGRGLFYFIDLNAKILAHSGGARSLDDLVLAVVKRRRAGEQVGESAWVDLVAAELGEQGRHDFAAMVAGAWIIPAPDALGPRFTRHPIADYPLDFGFATSSIPTQVVTGLVAGSVAEQAGVREGDRLLSMPNFSEIERAPWNPIALTLGRGETTLRVHYIPQGAAVRSYAWVQADEERDGAPHAASE